jgi:hypothetical protein
MAVVKLEEAAHRLICVSSNGRPSHFLRNEDPTLVVASHPCKIRVFILSFGEKRSPPISVTRRALLPTAPGSIWCAVRLLPRAVPCGSMLA